MTFGRFTERLVGILAGIALVRLLTKEDYGTFLQVGLIGEICASVVLLGLPQSLLFFLPREAPERRKRLILQTALLLGAEPSSYHSSICCPTRSQPRSFRDLSISEGGRGFCPWQGPGIHLHVRRPRAQRLRSK